MLVAENYTFKFYHNAEIRLYLEDARQKDDSIFRSVYRSFFKELEGRLLDRQKDSSNKRVSELQNNLNNIFAFIGERGTGKSSCMLSVAKMLEENTETPVVDRGQTSFKVLESTDPSFFDETTNILDIFLGHLFNDFKTKWEKSNQDNIKEKNDLLESFEKVKQTISCMDFKKRSKSNCISSEDNVDRLLDLGASVNLAKDIQNLIQLYLKFFNKDVLVIPVDDIDLHSSCAYEMVEEIRKYLALKNVIVLMALKIEQLQKVVEKKFLNEFSDLISQKLLYCEQISEMANKYLIKLIPENQRFNLPTIDVMYNRLALIYDKCRENASQTESDNFLNQKWLINESLSGYPVRYIIVKLIFSKTRYLFYHMQGATSFIIPHTLREYNQLLELLLEMPDYKKGELSEQNQHNKDVFRQYFIQSWCKCNLNENDGLFIKYLFSIEDPSIVNKIVVQKLHNRFPNVLNENSEEVKKILDEKNRSYNISVGDVNLLLRLVKGTLVQFCDKAFIFAIETFYSMRLYEYYDYRTELAREIEGIERNVLVKNDIDKYSSYEMLVGGSFFNLKGEDSFLIPRNVEEHKRRDYRLISLDAIRKCLIPLLSQDKLNGNEIKLFKLCEFFALLILRRKYDPDEDGKIKASDYRSKVDIIYASEFGSNQQQVWFDVMSFFSNLVNVERCYNRIDKRFLEMAKKNEKSLYNSLLKYCKDNRPHAQINEEHPLLSYCTIRNMEILNGLFNYINEESGKRKYIADNRVCLIEFFKLIQGYFIKSYDEKPKKEDVANRDWYQIDFCFVTEFIDLLKDVDIKDSFDKIFSSKSNISNKNADVSNVKDAIATIVNGAKDDSDNNIALLDGVISLMDNVKNGGAGSNDDTLRSLGGLIKSLAEKQKNKIIQKTEAIEVTPEKKVEQNIDFSKLDGELRSFFNEDVSYRSDDVKLKFRECLRKRIILDHRINSWISRKFKGSLKLLTYSDISKSIRDFINYMQNRKERT